MSPVARTQGNASSQNISSLGVTDCGVVEHANVEDHPARRTSWLHCDRRIAFRAEMPKDQLTAAAGAGECVHRAGDCWCVFWNGNEAANALPVNL